MGAHTTADDPSKYRDTTEADIWRPLDPLLRVQKYLQQRAVWSETWEHQILEEGTEEVEQAMNEAEAMPPPSPQEMFRYMYATMPPALREQEAALLAWLQQKG
jgi:pyruvate dehydrogenase E1 component alpha subunit